MLGLLVKKKKIIHHSFFVCSLVQKKKTIIITITRLWAPAITEKPVLWAVLLLL